MIENAMDIQMMKTENSYLNHSEKEAYYIKEHHVPIIDRETFDKVQAIHKERSNMKYNEYNMPIERKKTRYVSKKNDM